MSSIGNLGKALGALFIPDRAAQNKAMARQAQIYSGAASAKKNRAQAEKIRQETSELAKLFSKYPIQGKLRDPNLYGPFLPGQEKREPLPKMSVEDKILAFALRAPKNFGSTYESIYKGRGTDLKNRAFQNVQDMISGLDVTPEVKASLLNQSLKLGQQFSRQKSDRWGRFDPLDLNSPNPLLDQTVKTEDFKGQEILSRTEQDRRDSILNRGISEAELGLKQNINKAKIGRITGQAEDAHKESEAKVGSINSAAENLRLLNQEKIKNEIRERLNIDAGTQLKFSEKELVDINKEIKALEKGFVEKLNLIKIKKKNLEVKAKGEENEYKRKQYEENLRILKQREANLIQDHKNKKQDYYNKMLQGKQTLAVTQSIKQGKSKGSGATAKAKQFEESKNKTLATGKELLRMIDNDSSLVGGRGVFRKFLEDVRSVITGKASSGIDKDGNPISGPATEFAAKLNIFKMKLVKPLMGESRLSNEERERVDSLLGNSLFTSPEQLRANIDEALTIVGKAETSVGGNQGTPLPVEYKSGNIRIPLNTPLNVSNDFVNGLKPDTHYVNNENGRSMVVLESGEHVEERTEGEQ